MAGHRDMWRAEPDGVLAAEADGLRLVIQAPEEVGGPVRFLVLRRAGKEDRHAPIGSGVEESVGNAMEAAARMAGRLLSHPFGDAT